ncbi:MAG: hypothetical protein CL910_05395 [Deltaproteobacteria bacterium]|nr:hypothetical protein [Deltaproteobacteria bacterium]
MATAEQEGRWQAGEPQHRLDRAQTGPLRRPVVKGIVASNGDPEGLGRVEVSFPSIPGSDTSRWAPIVAVGAGSERGWFFRPEVGDEVLVVFLGGDPGRPVVLDSFWSAEVLPMRPGGPAVPGGNPERASRGVQRGIRQSVESGSGFLVLAGIVVEPGDRNAKSSYKVKVKFPWLPRDDQEELGSVWAHVVRTAGSGRGSYTLPEVGDEVAVAFLQGDPRQPVVLGSLRGRELPPVGRVEPGAPPREEPSHAPELPRGEGWCCRRGEIFVAPHGECRSLGGVTFPSPEEAERACGDPGAGR